MEVKNKIIVFLRNILRASHPHVLSPFYKRKTAILRSVGKTNNLFLASILE